MSNITLTGIHSVEPDTDGALLVTFITKYIGNYPMRLSAALIEDLRKCLPPSSASDVGKEPLAAPSSERDKKSENQNARRSRGDVAVSADKLKVRVPGDWVVTADTTRNVIVVVFDPKTDMQSGFALSPEAAANIAVSLVKSTTVISKTVKSPNVK